MFNFFLVHDSLYVHKGGLNPCLFIYLFYGSEISITVIFNMVLFFTQFFPEQFSISLNAETLTQCCFNADHRLRRWPNIETTLHQCLVFSKIGYIYKKCSLYLLIGTHTRTEKGSFLLVGKRPLGTSAASIGQNTIIWLQCRLDRLSSRGAPRIQIKAPVDLLGLFCLASRSKKNRGEIIKPVVTQEVFSCILKYCLTYCRKYNLYLIVTRVNNTCS